MSVDELVVLHAPWIRLRARRYNLDQSDADDLANETIYKCLSHKDKFVEGRGFKPWVCAIMHHTFITWYNRRRCVLFTGYEEYEDERESPEADIAVIFHDTLKVICECARMSQSIECVLLYAKGYSYEEISKLLKIPNGTVKSRVSNGRKLLRHALE